MYRPHLGNARNQMRMCPELSIFSNSEYVYAIFPIAVALRWGKGGREITESEPLSVIFTTLTHCLNKTAVSNYCVRTTGKWSSADTMVKGPSPLAPLDDWERSTTGPNPRMVEEEVPNAFYRPMFSLILATLSFEEMSRGGSAGSRKFVGRR